MNNEDQQQFADDEADLDAAARTEYRARGQDPFFQVSPEASYWTEETVIALPTISQIEGNLRERGQLRPYPSDPRDEIEELKKYDYANRYDPIAQDELGDFLRHPAFIARPPAGTIVNNRIITGRLPIIMNGAELATMFEAEKTAVWHQHALLTLLDLPGEIGGKTLRLREVISPVTQALMQAVLHMATFSALSAAWRFKWRQSSTPREISRRERPKEYFNRMGREFTVLYDAEIRFNANGDILRNVKEARRKAPSTRPGPGTPRHPAYGSGHSTYSKAASEILKIFLPPRWGTSLPGGMIEVHDSLDALAESIGRARFWGGVHWPADHCFGKDVGKVVADLIISQLDYSLVNPKPSAHIGVPNRSFLEDEFARLRKKVEEGERLWNWREDGPFPFGPGGTLNLQGGRVAFDPGED